MKSFNAFIDEKLNPIFGAFAGLPFISALNKAFIALLPLIMLGAFASLFSGLAIDSYQVFIKETGIYNGLVCINNLTLNLYGIWVAGSLGYYYSKQVELEKYAVILIFISIFAFLVVTPYTAIETQNYLSFEYLGAKGMFTSMIIAALSVRVYKLCIVKKIYLKMPKGVPPFIEDSFAGLIPALFIACICLIIQSGSIALGYESVNVMIYSLIAAPLSNLSGNAISIIFLLTIPSLFWFFGIHGGAATQAIIPPLLMPLAIENATAYAAGLPMEHMFAMGIMNLTGASTVVWCVVCIMSKQQRFKKMGKLAFVPALFGVTEPCNFGIPLVMNPYLFIPQLLMPVVNLVLMIILMELNILPYAHSMYVWGVPVFVSGFMQAGMMGVLFQGLLLIVDFLLVLPFFKAYDKSTQMNENEGEKL